jgi:hypothetical protein
MPPERRLRIRDPLGELLVSAADVLPKVRAGKIRAPATFACVRDLTKDAGEVAQGVLPALESVRLGTVRKTTALLRVLEVEGREPCFRSLICGITASVMRIFFARLVNRNSLRSS